MTREQLAAILGRVRQAVEQRMTILRIVVDERGEAIETIYRGSVVMTGADRPGAEAG